MLGRGWVPLSTPSDLGALSPYITSLASAPAFFFQIIVIDACILFALSKSRRNFHEILGRLPFPSVH
jgi:hypothetical protein